MIHPPIHEQIRQVLEATGKYNSSAYFVMHSEAAKIVKGFRLTKYCKGTYDRDYQIYKVYPNMKRYQLQNSYQDSGWETIDGEAYYVENVAVKRAAILSQDAICYGMVRVVDLQKGVVVCTYGAGGNLCDS
jgi:hypothetical protein